MRAPASSSLKPIGGSLRGAEKPSNNGPMARIATMAFLAVGAVIFGLLLWRVLGFGGGDEAAGVRGELQSITTEGSVLEVTGWASDADLPEGEVLRVRVTVDGEAVAAEAAAVATTGLPEDIEPSTAVGFTVSVPLDEGAHEVCFEVLGTHEQSLGCQETYIRTPYFETTTLIAHYGVPFIADLGIAGEDTPEEAAARAAAQAAEWEAAQSGEFADEGREFVPAFDMIASVATAAPGEDGLYFVQIPIAELRVYLEAIREVGGVMIIDIQTGGQDFLTVAQDYEDLLLEPDVGLAIDPEWRMPPGVQPGTQIGSVTVEEVNAVKEWLATLVRENNLPQKVFMIHQFTDGMVVGRERLQEFPELASVVHIDGFGTYQEKVAKYDVLSVSEPLINGLKIFFDEDDVVLLPAEIRALFDPMPRLITYQ